MEEEENNNQTGSRSETVISSLISDRQYEEDDDNVLMQIGKVNIKTNNNDQNDEYEKAINQDLLDDISEEQ